MYKAKIAYLFGKNKWVLIHEKYGYLVHNNFGHGFSTKEDALALKTR